MHSFISEIQSNDMYMRVGHHIEPNQPRITSSARRTRAQRSSSVQNHQHRTKPL